MFESELVTERLILREWELTDAPALYKYASDEKVGPRAGWPVHTSEAMSRRIIAEELQKLHSFAVCLKKDRGHIIGAIGIKQQDEKMNEAEIGYWIGVPFWGHGYMPEALNEIIRYCFDELNLTDLWCGYYDGNQQSYTVQLKCGFKDAYTVEEKSVPLLNEYRTEYFTHLTKKDWLVKEQTK
ncbi:hypothetical protein CBF37_05965 [Vagococcus vulneris]|uniref:N-acetyltransferase domain-containing protein n=2 Tax=Vagococcus vulneris TaxID=1977869 RepID=A0A429ZYG8_9ENTE|nr:hypothetical protein CBF37_05965 [Vagococcus vulneris]